HGRGAPRRALRQGRERRARARPRQARVGPRGARQGAGKRARPESRRRRGALGRGQRARGRHRRRRSARLRSRLAPHRVPRTGLTEVKSRFVPEASQEYVGSMASPNVTAPTNNPHLMQWVRDMASLTKPDQIVWLNGSEEEKRRLEEQAVAEGVLHRLD